MIAFLDNLVLFKLPPEEEEEPPTRGHRFRFVLERRSPNPR